MPVSRPDQHYAAGMLRYGIDHHRDRLTDAFVDIAEIYIADNDELQGSGTGARRR